MKKRFFSILLALVFAVGLLPGAAFAEEGNEAKFAGTEYATLVDALQAAAGISEESGAITLLKDVTAAADITIPAGAYCLEMGEYALNLGEYRIVLPAAVSNETAPTMLQINGGTVTGSGETLFEVAADAELDLMEVTLTNTAGVGLCSAGTVLIEGGSLIGKTYGVQMSDGTVTLAAVDTVVPVEGSDATEAKVVAPGISGETAAFAIDGGVIVANRLPEDASYTVAMVKPGTFAELAKGVTAAGTLFKAVSDKDIILVQNVTREEETVTTYVLNKKLGNGDLTIAAIDPVPAYNGTAYTPALTVTVDGMELAANQYTVSYTKGGEAVKELKAAGTYTVTVEGKNGYSDSASAEFVIGAARPVMSWREAEKTLTYTGKEAVLENPVTVTLVNEEAFGGQLKFAYRTKGGSGFTDGLPVAAGDYELKAAIDAAGNYAAADTGDSFMALKIETLSVADPVIELTAPQNGYVYNGTAIEPKVTVKQGETELASDLYQVTYENNINPGTAKVTVSAANDSVVFSGELTKTFTIEKAKQGALTITGAPSAVTYGDAAFKLGISGGSTEGTIGWRITEGEDAVSIAADGTVTVKGVGKVTIEATKPGDDRFEAAAAEASFTVAPKVLTVTAATAKDKAYDGKKTVDITAVTISGVVSADDVKVTVDQLQGEVSAATVGSYDKLTLPTLTLTGKDAAKYTLTQPAQAVAGTVNITKAELPKALTDITLTVAVDTENFKVENLGKEMPADAGTLTYANGNQSTSAGSGVIVMEREVSADGVLTSRIVNGKPGNQIIYEVKIGSVNYAEATVKVIVTLDTMKLTADNTTVKLDKTEYTYDGKEQKPKVTVEVQGTALTEGTDFEVKYPDDCKSVGEKELTVNFKGNYTGSVTAKYTVGKAKVTVSGTKADNKVYDGSTKATVTAGTLKGAVSGDDVKVTATGTFADKNSGSGKTVNVTYALSGAAAGNYELTATTDTVKANITTASTSYYSGLLSGMSESNVDSDDKATLRAVVSDIENIMTDANLSSSARTTFTNIQLTAEKLIARVESAEAAKATASVRGSEKITANTVQVTDKATLSKAQTDLNAALNAYGGNYTAAEKSAAEADLSRVAAALNVLTKVEAVEKQITDLSDTPDATAVVAARDAFNGLSDYEKTLVSAMALTKLERAEGKPVTSPEASPNADKVITNAGSGAQQDKDTIDIPFGLILAVAAVACGGAGFWFYRKRKAAGDESDEDLNW